MSKKLLFSVTIKDCEIQTFRSGGPGGQNQNKVESGVRIIHPPSGARGESREHRSQLQNKREAFVRMAKSQTFQKWAKAVAHKTAGGKTLEERVEESMSPINLRVEKQTENGWESYNE